MLLTFTTHYYGIILRANNVTKHNVSERRHQGNNLGLLVSVSPQRVPEVDAQKRLAADQANYSH
jgi:hypothetical protein